jgi:mannose-6-phosphate isomerase-like protein (cupin superfamily)
MPADVTTVPAEDKVWGETRRIHASDHCLVFHASIRPGTYCSQHYHEHRRNDFYVVAGVLRVHFYRNRSEAAPHRTAVLAAGQKCVAEPGEWHRFEALDGPVELIETYWLRIEADDIVRHDAGGRTAA